MSQLPRIFKYGLLILILSILYHQLFYGQGIVALKESWQTVGHAWQYQYLMVCVLLMPLNWYLESVKWQKLMAPHGKISKRAAIKTVLAGISLGIVTPARVGEYGGRLLTSNPDQKTQVISATLLGSIAQNLCNVVGGLFFSYFFLKMIFGVTYIDDLTFIGIISAQIVLFVLIYYHLPKVAHGIERMIGTKYIGKYSNQIKLLDLYTKRTLHLVLGISALRYMIYFCQYLCILFFLGVNARLLDLCGGISSIYLIQTGIPLPAFLGVLARGELAIKVWSSIGIDQITALVATFGLWLINLIIPSVVGLVVLMGFDFKKYFKK